VNSEEGTHPKARSSERMQIALDTNILIVLLRGKPEAPAQKVADMLAEYDRSSLN